MIKTFRDSKRIQLTLFIDAIEAVEIEKIRRAYNPEQYALIKSHVTLCREDELEQIEKVIQNVEQLHSEPITIHFGNATRFSEDKGVLIPAIGNNKSFQQLRTKVLHGIIESPRIHHPHITLVHPRNATCTDEIFEKIVRCNFPAKIQFKKIALIEQEEDRPWNILQQFELDKNKQP